jgi:hypothetical protein
VTRALGLSAILLGAFAGCSAFSSAADGPATNDAGVDGAAVSSTSDGGASSGGGPPVSLRGSETNQTADSADGLTIPGPAAAQPNDLLVAVVDLGDEGKQIEADDFSAGWEKISRHAGPENFTYTFVFTKKAVGGSEVFHAGNSAKNAITGVGVILAIANGTSVIPNTQNLDDTAGQIPTPIQTPKAADGTTIGDGIFVLVTAHTLIKPPAVVFTALDGFMNLGPIVSGDSARSAIPLFTVMSAVTSLGPYSVAFSAQSPDFATATVVTIKH